MAVKQYGYYLKGSKIALVEKDTSFDNDVTSKEYGPGSDRAQWKSPKSTVADGLEIQYTYVPDYKINRTNITHTDIAKYRATASGKLHIKGPDGTNYDTTLDAGNYIVLANAGKFNGLHKIDSFTNENGTNDAIVLDTSYSGTQASWTNFEETVIMYYDVSVLEDESFDIDLPDYICKAIVLYLKARLSEDSGNIEIYEYYMSRFRKQLEEFKAMRHPGPKMISGFWHLR